MIKRTVLQVSAAAAAAAMLAACAGGSNTNPPAQLPQTTPRSEKPMDLLGTATGLVRVLLGDAAPDFGGRRLQRLNLGIKEIDAIENGQVTVLASFDEPRIVDVLAHQNDDGEALSNTNVAQSQYQQLRLVVDLSSSSAKFTAGPSQPIDFLTNVTSASPVGAGSTTVTTTDGPGAVDLVVTQPFSIPSNHSQSVRVDFNAFESMALQSGAFLARAALFVAPIDDMGSIKGRILDASGNAVSNATVVAVAADGSVGNTDFTDDRGHFRVGTLRTGTYTLLIYNTYTTAAGRVVNASGQSSSAPNVVEGPTITITGGKTAAAGNIAD